MTLRFRIGAFVVCGALATARAGAQRGSRAMTLDWMLSDSGRRVAQLPQTGWLASGGLVMFDARRSPTERTIERVDLTTGARHVMVDAHSAIASLNALVPASARQVALDWPDAFDATGAHALYVIDGDLFVLDLASARFDRLTHTPTEEHSADFSPDGRMVSFVRENDLFVVDVRTHRETRLTHDGSATTLNGTLSWLYWEEVFGRHDVGYWWSPDSKRIAFLQTDESRVPIATFVDVAPVHPRIITQRYSKAGDPNPRVRVGVIDVRNPSTPAWMHVDAANGLLLRVNWLPGSARLAIETLTRDQHTLTLAFADPVSGRAMHILDEHDSAWVNVHDDLHFLRDGKSFLWASERDGYYHVYRYDDTGRLLNQVTSGDFAEASSGGVPWVRQSVLGVDEAHDWMYFTSMRQSPTERHLYRVHLDGSGLTRLTTTHGTHQISMSPDATWFVDVHSTADQPPTLEVRGAGATTSGIELASNTGALASFNISYPELIRIPARDGFLMPATIRRPRNFDATHRYPVIMEVYGGASSPIVEDAWYSWTLLYQLLVDKGFLIVQVDNRAATAISKRLEDVAYGTVGRSEVADLGDAATWLASQPWVDSSRIGVWGWSNGGYVTLNLLTRTTQFAAGISVAPVTDWRYYDTKWSEAFLGMPQANPAGYDSASVVLRAANLHGRLLLVHGSYDDNVHPQNEQAFIDALVRAGKTFDYMVYPMRKHEIGDRPARRHLYQTMIEFWERNLLR
ncbi:MAG TPA: S9 family peptidase [Gemmatimonadaceae bacterium]|nr:S9 family peptidase [Gemmatimonadaceae bacterium]